MGTTRFRVGSLAQTVSRRPGPATTARPPGATPWILTQDWVVSRNRSRERCRNSGWLGCAKALSSAKLPRDDVVDQLSATRLESGPALAVDSERGEGAGRELLLEPGQLVTARREGTRELVETGVVPD